MDVAVVGVGQTKFGEHWDKSMRELVAEAGIRALEDAGIEGSQVQAIFGGTMSGGRFVGQEHIGAMIADAMGLNPIPATRVEAACASGGVALRTGIMAIKSGLYDIVVVGGVEKMTEIPGDDVTLALGGAADYEWEVFAGATFPSLYALMMRRYMYEFNVPEEYISSAAVKNHEYGANNPYAQFRSKVTLDQVMNSSKVADPVKLLDSSPITDGAAAVVLASDRVAREITDTPVWILGSGHATDTLALHDRATMTTERATVEASKQAFAQARISHKDIGVVEVHDCFTISEILAIEDLGFFEKGTGAKATYEGETRIGGKVAVNTSGGLKSVGHPVGATGVRQIVDLTKQLRGEHPNQVDAEYALAHNAGGTGATVTVHILGR